MTAQSFGITFEGYWRDENEGGLPSLSGVYCVYVCVDHPGTSEVLLNSLLYIGEAEDVKERIAHHEKLAEWKRLLRPGEDLCYSFGHVEARERRRCAAALIFQHQPPGNEEEFRSGFPFAPTNLSLNGQIAHLHPDFTVAPVPAH